MSDALREAQTLYNECIDALRDQRRQIEEDLKFSDPSAPEQWEEEVKRQRETDPGGKRPCLVLDQTGQYVANVAGQVEKQPPSLHAIPVGGGADKKAAEQIDGRFRHIEYASKAQQHYTRAMTSAARVGVGYIVIRPEIVDAALRHKEPRISSEPDALRVVFDPWSTATDGSDADDAFIITPMPISLFQRRHKGKALVDFGDMEGTTKADDRKSILIAEHWCKEDATKEVFVWVGPDGEEKSGTEDEFAQAYQASQGQAQFVRQYRDKTTQVKWERMTGADVLEESIYPADSIGVVPIYGYVGFKDGRMKYCGIPRRARGAQQAYNYHSSELLVPASVILMPERGLGGGKLKDMWDKSRVERRGFLPYKDFDEDGVIAPPSLMLIDPINHAEGAAQALRDIQASIGMYQANIGADSNVTSGVAYDAQKQQGEASTAHFPSHMAASLGHVGQIVLQMDARLADTQRKQPIIGVDGTAGSVDVNPGQEMAFQRVEGGVSINPHVGKYGVRVVVGASYSTQRKETNIAFGEIMRGNKELAQVVAPFWAQTLDFPGSDKFAQAMAAMAPPAVKAIIQPEGAEQEQDPAMLMQQVQDMQQALQEAVQTAQEAQEEIATLQQANKDKAQENEIKQFDAETKRLQVVGANQEQIAAITEQLVNDMLAPVVGQMDQVLNPPQQEMEPEMPDPMMQEMAQGQQQIADAMASIAEQVQRGQQDIAQGQESIAQMLQELAALTKKTRKRIPVRDTDGNITEVIDRMEED